MIRFACLCLSAETMVSLVKYCPKSFDCFESKVKALQGKVEKILKGSLDSISSPSPSMKIQIMGGKVSLSCKRQNIAGLCQQTFCFQKFVDNAKQFFAFTPQANFSACNLNFH